jgi:Na+-driven multidrug efflux pump
VPKSVVLASWASSLPVVVLVSGWLIGHFGPISGWRNRLVFFSVPISIFLAVVSLALTPAAWGDAKSPQAKRRVRIALAISLLFVLGCCGLFAVYMSAMSELQKQYDKPN